MLIGITGKARSGKDTFAEMLAEELYEKTRKKFILMAYATELKQRCQKDFNLSYEQLWGDDKESVDSRYPKECIVCEGGDDDTQEYWTAREILQAYGQFFRTIKYDFWVDALYEAIEDKEYKNVIITDVRHPNEADPVREKGGVVIKVTSARSDMPGIHGSNHISETAMDDYQTDYVVANDFGLPELRAVAREIATLITNKGD